MTGESDQWRDLEAALAETLDLIRHDRRDLPQLRGLSAPPPLESLLDQCRAVEQDARRASEGEAIGLIKHFACTGGTIIAKCVAAMPNTVLLSEMDPLSVNMTSPFTPSDLIRQLHFSRHPLPQDLAIEIFLGGLAPLQRAMIASGRRLVLRVHSHSQYCTAADWTARPSVQQIVERAHKVRSVVTVRHPMASFLSLQKNRWIQFSPKTLEEYARRYLAFLDDESASPILFYEDFVADPEPVLQEICRLLALPYTPMTPAFVSAIAMSGNSGRAGDAISARPSREIPEPQREEAATSPSYAALCERLGYPLLPEDRAG